MTCIRLGLPSVSHTQGGFRGTLSLPEVLLTIDGCLGIIPLRVHYNTPVDSSILLVIEITLGELRGSQNKRERCECGKETVTQNWDVDESEKELNECGR